MAGVGPTEGSPLSILAFPFATCSRDTRPKFEVTRGTTESGTDKSTIGALSPVRLSSSPHSSCISKARTYLPGSKVFMLS